MTDSPITQSPKATDSSANNEGKTPVKVFLTDENSNVLKQIVSTGELGNTQEAVVSNLLSAHLKEWRKGQFKKDTAT